MKTLLVDFDDSFTYNIASVLFEMGIESRVIRFTEFKDYSLVKYLAENGFNSVVLGPGPGHPLDYDFLFDEINSLLKKVDFYTVGVCLGHQLIWSGQGYDCIPCSQPIHGQNYSIEIPSWSEVFPTSSFSKKTLVQRYNSLKVDVPKSLENSYFNDDEFIMGFGANFFSCQFHPESVGTSDPELFFHSLLQFLYNKDDGK